MTRQLDMMNVVPWLYMYLFAVFLLLTSVLMCFYVPPTAVKAPHGRTVCWLHPMEIHLDYKIQEISSTFTKVHVACEVDSYWTLGEGV